MKKENKKSTIFEGQILEKKQLKTIVGGDSTPTKVVNVGNTIVDDLNGLIR